MSLRTVPVHVDPKTLAETTGTALVAACSVDGTFASCRTLRLARVLALLVNAALEETRTT